jgi:antitoxin (DNA-binding transcriptional repressor) of toxin-antitoxin stability system
MYTEISIGEMEAQYFEILKRVCLGESFIITVDGRQVAEIRPHAASCGNEETAKVLEELCSPRFDGATDEAIREWLGEEPPRGPVSALA